MRSDAAIRLTTGPTDMHTFAGPGRVSPPAERVAVTNAEVMAFATDTCSVCRGTGTHTHVSRNADGQEQRDTWLCTTALQRFLRKNPEARFDPEDKKLYRLNPEV